MIRPILSIFRPFEALIFPPHKGHDARMIVPFPSVDSISKEPPESSVRSLMLERPNPLFVVFLERAFSRLKPSAVVLENEFHPVVQFPQRQTHKICLTVFGDVVHCFLGDSENDDLQGRWHITFLDFNLLFNPDLRIDRLKPPAEPGKSRQETQVIKHRWP